MISNGRLITHVTASSRVGLTNQTLTPAVRSISQTDLILVDNFGRVSSLSECDSKPSIRISLGSVLITASADQLVEMGDLEAVLSNRF